MLNETFWTVGFLSPNTGINGSGVVFLYNNHIFGGDAQYYYTGSYNVMNEVFDGELEITHYSGAPLTIFGQAMSVKIKLSGKVQVPNMKLTGHLIDYPGMTLQITCTMRTSKIVGKIREGIFHEGQYYDAQRVVKDIFLDAQKRIAIIDNYISEMVFDLLVTKKPAVEVSILTQSITPDIRAAAIAFNKQYGNLSIRTSKNFHDCFVITDDHNFFHFGASIKDLAKRVFMFSRIEEQEIINSIKAKFDQEWRAASIEVKKL
jgi:hypothetical protein